MFFNFLTVSFIDSSPTDSFFQRIIGFYKWLSSIDKWTSKEFFGFVALSFIVPYIIYRIICRANANKPREIPGLDRFYAVNVYKFSFRVLLFNFFQPVFCILLCSFFEEHDYGNFGTDSFYLGCFFAPVLYTLVLIFNLIRKRMSLKHWKEVYIEELEKQERKEQLKAEQKARREQEEFNRQKAAFREAFEEYKAGHAGEDATTFSENFSFFSGCETWEQVKARYKKLMQLYHPDLEAGDEDTAKIINEQYDALKKKFNA